jgi:hypothetical protein
LLPAKLDKPSLKFKPEKESLEMPTTARAVRTPKRVTHGTLKSHGVYPKWHGEKGQAFKTIAIQLTKHEAIKLARMLRVAARDAQDKIDLCGFRHNEQVTVTSRIA